MLAVGRFHLAVCFLLVLSLGASSCRVSNDQIDVARSAGAAPTSFETAGSLPAIGPIPMASHWHAAYVVRLCDDVLAPFESDADPLGIHSHGDGIMHVHPFFEEAGYEAATIGVFADAVGFSISDGELTLPGGGTWRDGDLCDGIEGRVFVDRWQGPSPDSPVERIFTDLDQVRFLADGELYQIAFAPADSPPVVPPSVALLPELSNLAAPPEPWVDVPVDGARDRARIWPVADVSVAPCNPPAVSERVRYGDVRCFEPVDDGVAAEQAVASARAVELNRQPAIEIRMTDAYTQTIQSLFIGRDSPLVLAIEIDGEVVTAPQLTRAPVSDRLVISGGMSVETAKRLAAILGD